MLSLSAFAQTDCPDHSSRQKPDKYRFQRPEYQRYQEGTWTVGGLPVVGGFFGNRDTFSLDLGAVVELGYFSLKRVFVGVEVAYVYSPTKPEPDYNHQRFSTRVFYFLSDRRRATAFIGYIPYIHRWNYVPTEGFQFFNDPIDGSRRTFWVPGHMITGGVSLKLGLNWSTQFGIAYNKAIDHRAGRNPVEAPIQYGRSMVQVSLKKG